MCSWQDPSGAQNLQVALEVGLAWVKVAAATTALASVDQAERFQGRAQELTALHGTLRARSL